MPIFSLLFLGLLGCGLETYNQDSAVGARLELIPEGELSFERVPANKASTAILTVLSTGDERMVVDAVVLSGPQADRFVLPDELPLPIGLAPGTDFPVNISFRPTAQGQFSALVEVTPRSGPVLSRRIVGQACEDQGGSNLCPP